MELLWEIRIFGYDRKGYERVRNITFYVKIAMEMLVLLVLPYSFNEIFGVAFY